MAFFEIRWLPSSCAVLAACLGLAACGGASSAKAPAPAYSTAIYLVRDAEGSNDPGVPIYHLMSVSLDNPQPREIAKLGAVNGTFSVDPEHKLVGLATDYTDNPELLLVDIESGAVSNATDSQGGDDSVRLGPHGAVAFCDSKGAFKVGTISQITQSAIVEQHYRAQGCPDPGWSHDSTLAFVAEAPLNNPVPGQHDQALYVRASDGALSSIELPGIRGYSAASWSSDGQHVAFSAGYNQIVVVDTESREVKTIGPGSGPVFAPNESSRFVALRFEDHDRFIEVWDNDVVVASMKFDEAGLAWCPGGDEIALATSGGVSIWNWRTGKTRLIARAQFFQGQLIETSVACY